MIFISTGKILSFGRKNGTDSVVEKTSSELDLILIEKRLKEQSEIYAGDHRLLS